eukprot:357113-Chlamydomonas_euryale.AAC.1
MAFELILQKSTSLESGQYLLGSPAFDRYAKLALPLNRLTKQDVRWDATTWTPEASTSFEGIKHSLLHAPCLSFYDPDAGGLEVLRTPPALALVQSKKLDDVQQRWHPGEQELYAVVHALAKWRCYLEGLLFKIHSDHHQLQGLITQPNLSRRQVQWSEYLQRFEFTWHFPPFTWPVPGRQNMADPLSRLPTLNLQMAALATMTLRPRPPQNSVWGKRVNPLSRKRTRYKKRLQIWTAQPPLSLWFRNERLVVPDVGTLHHDIVAELHSSTLAAHNGVDKTTELVMRTYWWPGFKGRRKAHSDLL